MSTSDTLESYLAAFKRHSKPRHQSRPSVPATKVPARRPVYEADFISVSTVSSIDTDMLLRSDVTEIVAREAQRNRERVKGKHKKNVHSMPLSIIQENSELASRSHFAYNIHDYLPQSSAPFQYREAIYARPPEVRPGVSRRGKQQYLQPRTVVEKQSTVSSVDTDALLQSSDDDFDAENFPISHLTKELLDKRHHPLPPYRPDSRESISPRYNPVVSIGNTSRASPTPAHIRKDTDIQMPLISPSPDLTTHTRTMSMPISPARGRKLSETTTVMVENNKQILLCPSQRSEEKASLESTLQKCLGAQGTYFQEPPSSRSKVPAGVSITPKFSNKPNLQIKHPFDQSSSSRRGDSPPRPSFSSSDPSEAFEAFCRDQLPPPSEEKPPRRQKANKTYIKLKVCTCILAGMINSHKPGCKVTTVTALLPTRDSSDSSFGSLCNLKSGTTHSYMQSTGSGAELNSSRMEERKKKKKLSIVEAVILIQRKFREFYQRRKDSLSLAYSRSTNDRSSAPSDIERATRSIYSAIDHLQELKTSAKPSPAAAEVGKEGDLLSLDELVVSVPQSEANSELLDLSGEQFGRVVRQGDIHAVIQNSWSDFLQRESGETLWIDASTSSIEGLGSKELALS